jgi:hypothetical protein
MPNKRELMLGAGASLAGASLASAAAAAEASTTKPVRGPDLSVLSREPLLCPPSAPVRHS